MIKVCKNCEREFETYDKTRKFCSHKCFHENQIKEHSATCPICNKVFHKSYKGQKYCSRKCRDIAKITTKVKLICPVCEKVFYKKQSDIKNVKGEPCCSLKCNHVYKQKYYFLQGKVNNSPLYKVWNGVMQRCYNSKQKAYKHYGGRGIWVSEEWQNFENFYNWANTHGYKEGLTIERIDVNQGYSESNCKWATQKEQQRNKRNTIRVMYNNQEMCLKDVAIAENISYKSLWQIYKRKKDINEALKICHLHGQGLIETNTSGFRGVGFYYNAWNVRYKDKYLGRYKTFEEAVQVRLNAEKQDKERVE